MKSYASKELSALFDRTPKKKGKTIGNPPTVQQMPYSPRKSVKK